jgi:uncharacterized protein
VKSCVVLFGRQPVPGRAKTRLAPALGADGAAAVAGVMLQHALTAAGTAGVEVHLSLAEAPADDTWAPRHVSLSIQLQGDLGERMHDVFEQRFADGFDRVVLTGTDIPLCSGAHLRAALRCLDEAPVVLGPAEDGGYYLVGQRTPGADIFRDIPWSSEETLHATHDRLTALGLSYARIETLPDVDTPDDLRRVLRDPRLAAPLREALHDVIALGGRR